MKNPCSPGMEAGKQYNVCTRRGLQLVAMAYPRRAKYPFGGPSPEARGFHSFKSGDEGVVVGR